MIGHSESVNVEFEKEISAERAREILSDPQQSPAWWSLTAHLRP